MLRSLRSRLILLLALALLPASTLAVIQAVANYRQVKALTERNMLQSSAIIAGQEKNEIDAAHDTLARLAGLSEIRRFAQGSCAEILRAELREIDKYEELMVLRLDGSIACASSEETSTFGDTEWFARTLRNETFTVSGNVTLHGESEPALLTTLPLRRDDSKIVGVIAIALRNVWLQDLLRNDNGRSLSNTSVALLDRRGSIMAESAVEGENGQWMPAAFVIGTRMSGQAQVFRTEGRDGVERIFALAPMYEEQVFIVLGGVSGHLLRDPGLHLLAGLSYPVLMWGIAIAVAWFAVDRLVLRQILRLRRTANAYAEGHLEARTPGIEHAPQEIRELGMTMHKMADVIGMHEAELRESLKEQKTLLREVYHRVKNNLQVVSSLVNLQVTGAKNEHEKAALRTTQDRIYALSMVHSNLYQTSELHRIKLDEFVPQLCEYLRQAQGEAAEDVRMAFDIDPIQSEPERAVPLALLITEVVSNALKHDRPDDGEALLSITLKPQDDGELVMTVTDNGSTAEATSAESLGNRLIQAFARQLGGTVRIEDGDGFRLTLKMPAT